MSRPPNTTKQQFSQAATKHFFLSSPLLFCFLPNNCFFKVNLNDFFALTFHRSKKETELLFFIQRKTFLMVHKMLRKGSNESVCSGH